MDPHVIIIIMSAVNPSICPALPIIITSYKMVKNRPFRGRLVLNS